MVNDASRSGELSPEARRDELTPSAVPAKRKLAIAEPSQVPADEANKVVRIVRRLDEDKGRRRALRVHPWIVISIVAVVIVPTIVASIFYLFIASDRYISKANFSIRKNDSQSMDALGIITGMPSS